MLTIWKSVGRRGQNKPNDVMHVQLLLNANYSVLWLMKVNSQSSLWQPKTWAQGVWLVPDGDCGTKTKTAIEEYQRYVMKVEKPDGRVDPGGKTFSHLAPAAKLAAPPNLTAQFEDTRLAGKKRQAMAGRITVNHHTYYFNTGGHARGYLPPGVYTVTNECNATKAGFTFAGVGFTFDLNDARDKRLEAMGDMVKRTELLIHPDGNVPGTAGCIGILGGPTTLRTFRRDMAKEMKTNSPPKATLTVRKLSR